MNPSNHKPSPETTLAILDWCTERGTVHMAVNAIAGGGGGNVATKQEADLEAINAFDSLAGNPITKMTGRVMLA
jgi:hypothetical protein